MALGLCCSGGREIRVRGQNLDVVQTPRIRVTVAPRAPRPGRGPGQRHHVILETTCSPGASCGGHHVGHSWAPPACAGLAVVPLTHTPPQGQPWVAGTMPVDPLPAGPSLTCPVPPPTQFEEPCHANSSQLITCRSPALPGLPEEARVRVEFILDSLIFDFAALNPTPFSYEADPTLQPLNPEDPTTPFRHKPGSVLSVEVLLLLGQGGA